jgi:hypothetical protein
MSISSLPCGERPTVLLNTSDCRHFLKSWPGMERLSETWEPENWQRNEGKRLKLSVGCFRVKDVEFVGAVIPLYYNKHTVIIGLRE